MRSEINYREFLPSDYSSGYELWLNAPGISIGPGDDESGVHQFLKRNPGLSYVAVKDTNVVGTILAGYDGRRGYIYHLCVSEALQGSGIGRKLLNLTVNGLKQYKAARAHLFVRSDNWSGMDFWRHVGANDRSDVRVMSISLNTDSQHPE